MKKVANRKLIRTLSYRTMKEKKWKNLIAVLAIALTSLLFTALFTVGASLIGSIEEGTMRQVGTSAHGGYKYLTLSEYEQVKAAGGYRDIAYDVIAGFAVNPELSAIQTEVRYAEDKMAKWYFCYPEKGRMPETEKECAASSKVLEALGVPLCVGEKVPLTIVSHNDAGEEILLEEEFTLSGYWYSNDASMAQELWISQEWLEKNVDMLKQNYVERINENGNYNPEGSIQAGVFFDSSYDIEAKMEQLTERAGLDPEMIHQSANWAYATASVDGVTLLLGIGILGIILLSGYLIIYNIFYINVTVDIRYYGLLKTIGTTGRQLRRIVRQQAFLLSAAGIPLGLFLGWLVGKGVLPALFAALDTGGVRKVTLNPFIFAGSALFSLLTVYLSCIKPCRLAAKVSPIEAVRYVERQSFKKKERKSRKISMLKMAASNMGRNRKKAVLVIASLSLSLVLLNATYALVKGFSFDKYVRSYLVTDMQVSHASTVNMNTSSERDFEAVSPEVMEKLKAVEGVKEVMTLWHKWGYVELSDPLLDQFEAFIPVYAEKEGMAGWEKQVVDQIIAERKVDTNIYALESPLFPFLNIWEGSFDEEKFQKGGYAVVLADKDEAKWMKPGDVITAADAEGTALKVEIMAVGNMPRAMSAKIYPYLRTEIIVSEKDFHQSYQSRGGLMAGINVEEGKEGQVEKEVGKILAQENKDLVLSTKETLRKEFSTESKMFSSVGGLLSFILTLIGVLNLINAMITSILSRKQEFAMMQAVGMTGRQLEKMLMMEGILYGAYTLLITATLGNAVSCGCVYLLGKNMAYFEWKFPILPLLASIPVIAGISVLLPVCCYHALCKKSIIERLRISEI